MKNRKYNDLKKGDEVQYIGESTNVLENGKIFEVFSVMENGIQVYIPTGFAGLNNDLFAKIRKL